MFGEWCWQTWAAFSAVLWLLSILKWRNRKAWLSFDDFSASSGLTDRTLVINCALPFPHSVFQWSPIQFDNVRGLKCLWHDQWGWNYFLFIQFLKTFILSFMRFFAEVVWISPHIIFVLAFANHLYINNGFFLFYIWCLHMIYMIQIYWVWYPTPVNPVNCKILFFIRCS